MEVFLALMALVWCFFGFGILSGAKSAIHEILAAILFSFAVLFIGVGGILHRLKLSGATRSEALRSTSSVDHDRRL